LKLVSTQQKKSVYLKLEILQNFTSKKDHRKKALVKQYNGCYKRHLPIHGYTNVKKNKRIMEFLKLIGIDKRQRNLRKRNTAAKGQSWDVQLDK
jgi:hypothetical protein